LPSRRADVLLAAALAGAVVCLDLLWGLAGGSTGALAYGLVDEPAHLGTCALLLLAIAAASGRSLVPPFVAAALISCVAIDVDHLPGYLGWDGLIGAMPRPYTHSLLLVGSLLALAWTMRSLRLRQVLLGAAFGVSTHLLRDLTTGPGVPLGWPVSDGIASLPYPVFAAILTTLVLIVAVPYRSPLVSRFGLTVALAGLLLVPGLLVGGVAQAHTVGVGAYIRGADQNPSLIDDFNAKVGRQATIVLSYKEWSQPPFHRDQLEGIWNRGAVPLITWEPVGIPLGAIARGDYDGYVWDAAASAAAWDRPLMVRFGQEMNGDWFTWGGHPAAFKRAWRHLVKVFRHAGADKVRWVWTPYANSRGGQLPFAPYYPGAQWVDWVGLDAINWGSPFKWRTFEQIVGESYRQLVELSQKPVILAETGSGELGGSKARWFGTMLRHNVPRMSHVRAVAFWSAADPRGDLRVDASPATLAAIRNALGRPLYRSTRFSLLRTPPHLGR